MSKPKTLGDALRRVLLLHQRVVSGNASPSDERELESLYSRLDGIELPRKRGRQPAF